MKRLVLLALVTVLSACASGPAVKVETPQLWLEHFKQGTFFRDINSIEVDRPYAQVLEDIVEFTVTCADGTVTRETVFGGPLPTTSSTLYRASVVPMDTKEPRSFSGGGLFVLQIPQPTRISDRIGNYYALVAEISPIAARKTRVSSHYLIYFKKFAAPLNSWAQGSKTECPKTSFR